MVLQSWIIECLKIYKLSDKVIKFIEKTMENWRVELTAGGNGLAEVNIQRGMFLGDVLSPLIFVIVINHILRKCTGGHKLTKLQEKINHLMYIDDFKLSAKNEKELETLIQAVRKNSQVIGMEFGIKKCTMLIMIRKRMIMLKALHSRNISKLYVKREDEERGFTNIECCADVAIHIPE